MATTDASLNASGTTAAVYFRLVGMLDVARKVRQYVHSEGAKASEIYQRTDLRTRQAERRVPKLAFLHTDLAYQLKVSRSTPRTCRDIHRWLTRPGPFLRCRFCMQLLSKIVNQLAAAHDDAFLAYDVRSWPPCICSCRGTQWYGNTLLSRPRSPRTGA